MVMPPMWTSSNFPFSKVRTSSGSSKRFRTVSSILHSAIQPRDAECVWGKRDLAKAGLMHAAEHFVGRGKAFDRRGQIGIRATHSRKYGADRGKNFLEVDAVTLADQSAGLSEIEDAAFSAGSQHARNLAQSGIVVGQVAEAECRCHQMEITIGKRQPKRVGFDPLWRPQRRTFSLGRCALQHGVREIRTYNLWGNLWSAGVRAAA